MQHLMKRYIELHKPIAFNNVLTPNFLMKLSDHYNQVAATALLRILLEDLFFSGGYIYCPSIFFFVLGSKQLRKFLILRKQVI